VGNRILIMLLTCAVVLAGFSPALLAQTPSSCYKDMSWWPGVDPLPFGWFICGPYPGTFVAVICGYTVACPPPPECDCKKNAPPNEGQKPISFATGNTYIEENDVSLPGLGGGLSLSRRWNSIWPAKELASSIGMFGPNWRSTYEERVFMGGDNWVKYSRGDGTYWSFGLPTTPGIGNTFMGVSPPSRLQYIFQQRGTGGR